MKLVKNVYRALRKVARKIVSCYSRIKTVIIFKGNGVSYSNFRTNGSPVVDVHRSGQLILGPDFAMNNGLHGNVIGFDEPCCFIVYPDCTLTIGKCCGISQSTIVAMNDVTIGDYVKIGGGTKIYTSDFHSLESSVRRSNQDLLCRKTSPVSIGDDVFIGADCIILKGVSIGNNAVVGAGSVITKDIPANQIWAGNPARFIRNI